MTVTGRSRRLIRIAAVRQKTGKSIAQIYRDVKSGTFPKSIATGPNTRAWVEDEVDAWIEARIADRDTGADDDLRRMNTNIGKGRPTRIRRSSHRHSIAGEASELHQANASVARQRLKRVQPDRQSHPST